MSDSLKTIWLKKSKIFFLVCFILVFLFKKWVIRSFPLFWWAMWANLSGRSPKMSDVSKSLRLLTKDERPWAIHSGRSPKMSESLRLLTKKKRTSELLVFFSELLIRSFFRKNRAIRSENRWANSQPCFCTTGYMDLRLNI